MNNTSELKHYVIKLLIAKKKKKEGGAQLRL